jgi:hypothetical protein
VRTPPRRALALSLAFMGCAAARHYSAEALRKKVQGTMYVRCSVVLNTHVEDCGVLQGLPEMNDNVKFAFEQRRYAPAVLDGVPTAVDFIFRNSRARVRRR